MNDVEVLKLILETRQMIHGNDKGCVSLRNAITAMKATAEAKNDTDVIFIKARQTGMMTAFRKELNIYVAKLKQELSQCKQTIAEYENHRHAKPVSAKDIEELIIEVNSRPEVCIEMYTAKDEAEAIINKYSVHERNE